jgi:hypothetical protein
MVDGGTGAHQWDFGPPTAYAAWGGPTTYWEYHWDFDWDTGGCYNSGTTALTVQCAEGTKTVSETDASNGTVKTYHHDFGNAGLSCHITQNEGWTPALQGTCKRRMQNLLAITYGFPKACY